MDICIACRRNFATFLCLCTSPFPAICQSCIGEHIQKAAGNSHSLEPIAARNALRSESDIPRYRARQQSARLAEAALGQNWGRVEAYREKLNELLRTISDWTAEKFEALDSAAGRMQQDMSDCVSALNDLKYSSDPQGRSRLALIVTGASGSNEEVVSQEMEIFHYEAMNPVEIRTILDEKFNFYTVPPPHKRSPQEGASAHTRLQRATTLSRVRSEPTGTSTEELQAKLSKYEQISVKNEAKIDEKNEKIRQLEAQIAKIHSEKEGVAAELAEAKGVLRMLPSLLASGKIQTTNPGPVTPKMEQEVQPMVTCDGCRMRPLVGPRWKCQTCDNFDFCQECYDNKPHPGTHSFKKVPPGHRNN